jgi:hypothetical protein
MKSTKNKPSKGLTKNKAQTKGLTRKTKRVRFKCEQDESYSITTIITLTPSMLASLNGIVNDTRYSRCSLVRVALASFVNRIQGKNVYPGVNTDEKRIRTSYESPESEILLEAGNRVKKLIDEYGVEKLGQAIDDCMTNGENIVAKKLVSKAA